MNYLYNLNFNFNHSLILSGEWLGAANKINGGIGVLAGAVENLSGDATIGTNLKIYRPTFSGRVFQGNQHVTTVKMMKAGRILGYGTLALGTAFDGYGVYNYYTKGPDDPNAVHPGKASLNLTVGLWGLLGIPSAIGAAAYYGIDAFYPGGFPAAMERSAEVQRRDRIELGFYPKD